MTGPATEPGRAETGRGLRVGTRGSALALTQTGHVVEALVEAAGLDPADLSTVRVRTEGDRLTGSLAALGGAGVFVAALREAVLDGRCDVAVHSLKDLPVAPAPGLVLAAVPRRVDARDALCARDGLTLADLPAGARVGTGSPRRAAQLLAVRPDLEVLDIRGNVDTRLGRVAGRRAADGTPAGPGDLDAVVLAAAGLARMGLLDAATELLEPVVMAPAPGQGALAVECRPDVLDDPRVAAGLAALDHEPTRLAVTAERALLGALEAGCAAPVGAHALVEGTHLHLDAVVTRTDGAAQMRTSAALDLRGVEDPAARLDAARALGAEVARQMLADGVADLAPLGPGTGGSGTPDPSPDPDAPAPPAPAGGPVTDSPVAGWHVLVPHGGEWGERVQAMLAEHGADGVVVPLIEFAPPADVPALDAALVRLASGTYDWVTVTSATTVTALVGRAAGIVEPTHPGASSPGAALSAILGSTRVAAVGPGTARALERYGVTAHLVPTGERSARGLVAEFPPPPASTDPSSLGSGGRVLVPHSDLADGTVATGLRDAGWDVDEVVAYRTVSGDVDGAALREDMRAGSFDAVLLSSASTVTNLVELVGPPPPTTVICCIGPRTRQAALDHGLRVDVVPEAASAEGLVEALVAYGQGHRS